MARDVDHGGVPIAVLTLNRPNERNPVDETTIAALETRITEVLAPPSPRALIITRTSTPDSAAAFSASAMLGSRMKKGDCM